MPNWCNNKLTVFGPDEDVERFKKTAIGNSPWHTEEEKKNVLNFHSLVPIPPEILSAGYEQAPSTTIIIPHWRQQEFPMGHESCGMKADGIPGWWSGVRRA